jgi:hypothetical protein
MRTGPDHCHEIEKGFTRGEVFCIEVPKRLEVVEVLRKAPNETIENFVTRIYERLKSKKHWNNLEIEVEIRYKPIS